MTTAAEMIEWVKTLPQPAAQREWVGLTDEENKWMGW